MDSSDFIIVEKLSLLFWLNIIVAAEWFSKEKQNRICKWISEPKDVYSFEEGVILSFACIIFANSACIICRGISDLSRRNFDKV